MIGWGMLCALSALGDEAPGAANADERFAALVFSKTAGYRHASIETGIESIRRLGERGRFRVDATELGEAFSDDRLGRYRVVIFLNTTGDVLDAAQQAAFERFVRRGGGFVGIHSASDTEYDWAWYGGLVGAYFLKHPAIQPATLRVVDRSHPSTSMLPVAWVRRDEWYNFRDWPDERVRVLVEIDERSYSGGSMGYRHPMAWCHVHDGGRAWYTALGHTAESYAEPLFQEHLLGGILWSAGMEDVR
jgi:type 1 glutamine amidotransferase